MVELVPALDRLVGALDPFLGFGDAVRAVDELEVGEVVVVLGHLLARRGDGELSQMGRRPRRILELGDRGKIVERLVFIEVVPGPDRSVALDRRIWPHSRP